MRRPKYAIVAAAAIAAAAVLGSCNGQAPTAAPLPIPRPIPTQTSVEPSPAPPSLPASPATSPDPAASMSPSPSPSPSQSSTPVPSTGPPAPPADGLGRGDSGPDVLAWQQRLQELGYWSGELDGRFGLLAQQATYALQKAAGLTRDGRVGADDKRAAVAGIRPSARSTTGRVIEIDRSRQLLMLVDGGVVTTILNTSTGRSGTRTPRGHYRIYTQVDGLRRSSLGLLWRPKYFNSGIAIHGYTSVPPYPASHGCVRLTYAAMDWLWASGGAPLGTPVWVY